MKKVDLGNGEMVQPEELAGIEDGEELFKKILEPFRGRPVLIDVWGTWCSPCRDGLKQFAEERRKLDPYGVVYMFFANNSPQNSWKNVITDLGITGDNVVHYHLPGTQENAIEHYLNLGGYPHYILVTPDGTPLFDFMADPRYNIHNIEKMIRKITGRSE